MKKDNKNKSHVFFDECGQGVVEYSLVIGLVALVVMGALVNLQTVVGSKFDSVNSAISGSIGS